VSFKLYDRVKFTNEDKEGVVNTFRGEFRGYAFKHDRDEGLECAIVHLDEGFYNEAQTVYISDLLVTLDCLEAEPEEEMPFKARMWR